MKCPIDGCDGEIKFIHFDHRLSWLNNNGVWRMGSFQRRKEEVYVTLICSKGAYHYDKNDRPMKAMRPNIWELPEEVFETLPEYLQNLSKELKKEHEEWIKENPIKRF